MNRYLRSSLVLTLGLWMSVGLWAVSENARADWPKDVKKAFKSITVKECAEHVRELASDDYEGRGAGTEGGRRASSYVAERFAEMGLRPAGTHGYFQSFQLTTQKRHEGELDHTNRVVAFRKGSQYSLDLGSEFVPDARSAMGGTAGSVLYLGSTDSISKTLEDAELELQDRIVLLFGDSAPLFATAENQQRQSRTRQDDADDAKKDPADDAEKEKPTAEGAIAALAQRGVRGVVLIPQEKSDHGVSAGAWPSDSPQPRAAIPMIRVTYTAANKLLRHLGSSHSKLLKETASVDLSKRDQSLYLEVSPRKHVYGLGRNVIGIWPGTTLADEYVVVGAHLDHVGRPESPRLTKGRVGEIHNGADDNASGTSGLIELAEAFATQNLTTERSLLFIAFDAEELGLVGSKYFVANPTVAIDGVKAMLNMDMISRNGSREMYFGSKPEFAGLNSLVQDIASGFGIHLNPDGMEQYIDRSDQAPFIAAGIPAVFLFGGMHPDYHTERDDFGAINPRKMEAIAQLMFLFAYECTHHSGSFK